MCFWNLVVFFVVGFCCFIFFSSSYSLLFVFQGMFFGRVLLLHLYTEPMKRFWLLLCSLGWSVEEPGGGEETSLKEICSSQNDTFIPVSLCVWVTCVLSLMVWMRRVGRFWNPQSPRFSFPRGWDRLWFLLAKVERGRSHVGGVELQRYQGLNWHLAVNLEGCT